MRTWCFSKGEWIEKSDMPLGNWSNLKRQKPMGSFKIIMWSSLAEEANRCNKHLIRKGRSSNSCTWARFIISCILIFVFHKFLGWMGSTSPVEIILIKYSRSQLDPFLSQRYLYIPLDQAQASNEPNWSVHHSSLNSSSSNHHQKSRLSVYEFSWISLRASLSWISLRASLA